MFNMKGDSMTEQNGLMILMSGSFLILWTTFKWKVPHVIWDNKWFRLCSRMLGSYSIIIAVISNFFKVELLMIFFIVDFTLFLLLDIGFVITKIKKARKGIIRNIQLGICLLFILCSLVIICLDMNEIASSIMGLCGAMMLLSTPFEEIKPFLKRKNDDSKQE